MRLGHGLAIALILTLGLAPALAADKPRDLLVGKWQPTNEKAQEYVLEFTRDGAFKVADKQGNKELSFQGKYKFVDDNTIETVVDYAGQTKTEKIKIVKISRDEMTTIDDSKREETFKRLK